jgi:hypothetical protein
VKKPVPGKLCFLTLLGWGQLEILRRESPESHAGTEFDQYDQYAQFDQHTYFQGARSKDPVFTTPSAISRHRTKKVHCKTVIGDKP